MLKEWVACAGERECIAPSGVTRWNHNFDQSAITMLLWRYGFVCERERARYGGEHDLVHVTFNPLSVNGVPFALRRWRTPRPYINMVKSLNTTVFKTSGGELRKGDIVQRNVEQNFFKNLFMTTWDVLRQSFYCSYGLFALAAVSLVSYFAVHKIAPLFLAADMFGFETHSSQWQK